MKLIRHQRFVMALFLLFPFWVISQSLVHPHIWVSDSDKQKILENIAQHDWARSMFEKLEERQGSRANTHKTNPSTLINQIEAIPGDRDKHRSMLNDGVECAILYYLTGNEDYAQVSADILQEYVRNIQGKNPETFLFFDRGRRDDFLIQTREDHPRLAIMYDFVEPFLRKSTTKVYNRGSGTKGNFNFTNAQKAFEVLVRNVLDRGGRNSNHSILELPGALYSTLCISNNSKRESLFNELMNGTARQDGITWMLNHFTQEEGMWPEAMGYSKFTHIVFLMCMNVIDRYKPNLNIINDNKRLLDGIFIFENFNYPNNDMMAFGDSNRKSSNNTNAFRMLLAISDRKNMNTYREQSLTTLKTLYQKQGGYDPQIFNQRLEWNNPLQLLWGVHIPGSVNAADIPLYNTITAKFAGIVMQRNYVENNNKKNGLMYYTGGATYVHAHATGIDMELYGRGHVMVPDYGSNTYGSDIHEQYASSYAAHNTVIVNGSSKRGPKTNGGSTWQNIVDDIVLEGAEPRSKNDPVSPDFSFTAQYLDDQWNDCKQLRTNAIIRTSETSGYYIDVFRSKANQNNDFHDYLIHGLGDIMTIKQNGNNLTLANTPNRYSNDIGDDRKQPGWRFFTEAKTSSPNDREISARFDLNDTNDFLHIIVPGSVEREYSAALAPPTQSMGTFSQKDTQMFIMRKRGEAWDEPFVALFEPSGNHKSTIQSTELLKQNNKIVGIKVISLVDNKEIIDYVLSSDKDGTQITLDQFDIEFKGRFGIVRSIMEAGNEKVDLYLGSGDSLSYKGKTLNGDNQSKGFRTFDIFTRQGPEGYTFLVDENGIVSSTVPVDIAYGANGSFEYLYDQRDDVSCTNNTFGDPLPGAFKSCYIRESKTYYGNQPINIPGTLEAEFYDHGGKNVSFWDKTDDNKGAPETNFRVENGVDIGAANGGMAIGWIGNGEWTEYTIDVEKAQYYDLTFHTSSELGGGRMAIHLDGTSLIDNIEIPETGSYDQFTTSTVSLLLPEGKHILRLDFEEGGFEIDKIVFTENTVLSVPEENLPEIKVFPNPSKDGIFYVTHHLRYKIFDILGNKLLESEGTTLNLSDYPKGVYLVRIDRSSYKLIIN